MAGGGSGSGAGAPGASPGRRSRLGSLTLGQQGRSAWRTCSEGRVWHGLQGRTCLALGRVACLLATPSLLLRYGGAGPWAPAHRDCQPHAYSRDPYPSVHHTTGPNRRHPHRLPTAETLVEASLSLEQPIGIRPDNLHRTERL